jgi:hypothetical protein
MAGAPIGVVGTLALAVVVSGSAVSFTPAGSDASDTAGTTVSEVRDAAAGGSSGSGSADDAGPRADDPTNLGVVSTETVTDTLDGGVADDLGTVLGGVDQVLEGDVGGAVGGVVDGITGVVDSVTGGAVVADVSLNLTGSGTPGANLSLQAAGQVYATTTVDANGAWALTATAIPGGVSSLDLVQQVDRDYLVGTLPGGGALATILGTVDGLVNALVTPLQLSSGGSEITVNLLG